MYTEKPAPSAEPDATAHELDNPRVRAMLRAVAGGRAEMSCSSEPDMFIDGIACCDQFVAHELARRGLIRPGRVGPRGCRVPATLSSTGRAMLNGADTAA